MSQSGVARAKGKAKALHEIDPDSVIVPIQLPKRLPYRPSIPVARLRAIVKRVVEQQEAEQQEAEQREAPALHASSE